VYAARSVRKRPLGKTGLNVSEMALGTWGISGDAYGAVEPEVAERVVRRAIDCGITLIETADAYGAGRVEAMLKTALVGRSHDVFVVTKGGTDRTSKPPKKRFSPEYLRGAIQRSAKRLGRDRLDVYLLHNPSSECLELGEATDAMEAFKKEGLVAHWGASVGDAETAKVAMDKGAEVIEMAYNLLHGVDLHRVAGEIMISGAGVLARSTLSYGLLAGDWTKEREFPEGDHRIDRWSKPDLARRLEQLDVLRYLVKGHVPTMRAAAIRWVLANNLVTSAVLGPRSVEQLEQLIREVGGGPVYLPDADLLQLPRKLTKVGVLM
jgi:aryl-alcohol dehydrogenase-like predicted oxidoreductase